MILKEKWKRGVAAVVAALSVVALSPAAASAAGTVGAPQYPDLVTLTPADLHLGTAQVNGQNHYVVRFSNMVKNAGQGPLELHGIPHVPYDGLSDAYQWIYESPVGVSQQRVGTFVFHPSHDHFHFDNFARYEIWTQRSYDRAKAANFTTGKPLAVAAKQSFCLIDSSGPPLFDSNGGLNTSGGSLVGPYQTCTPVMEGLSVGWTDLYDWLLPDQWVDVGQTPLLDGSYVVRSIVDPDNLLYESAAKADPARDGQVANSAVAPFSIVNGRLAGGA
jgi:hypothetical protein